MGKIDLFNYKNNSVTQLDREAKAFAEIKDMFQEMLDNNNPAENTEHVEVIKEALAELDQLEKDLVKEIRRDSVKINPAFDNQFSDQVSWFEDGFIKSKIPGAPSYIVKNEDGTSSVSLGLMLDLMDLKEHDIGIPNVGNLVSEVRPGVKYDVYDMGNGFWINSYGAMYLNTERVLNPSELETIPVYLIDFEKENIMLGFNKIKNGENDFLYKDSITATKDDSIGEYGKKPSGLGTGVRIPMKELGIKPNDLKDVFLFDNPNSKYYNESPTILQYKNTKPKIALDNVMLNEISEMFTESSEDEFIEKLVNSLTTPTRLNAEVETEEDDPRKKNYFWMMFLLILGGGTAGKAPLPKTNLPCDRYYKPRRTGIGFGSDQPGDGCEQQNYATGHKKIMTKGQYNGIKISLLQMLYDYLSFFFNINLKGLRISWGVNLPKPIKMRIGFNIPIIPSLSLGGEIEHALCKFQEKISEQIRKFFSVKKFIKLPSLDSTGNGFSFEVQERFDISNYSELQVEIYYRLNFARIFEFVTKEELFQVRETDSDTLESKLNMVRSIYGDVAKYGLTEMNKYRIMTVESSKGMYERGFHMLYNDNDTGADSYLTGITDGSKTYDDISPNNIWTLISNNMGDIDICQAKELQLETFNGNRYTQKGLTYSYSY